MRWQFWQEPAPRGLSGSVRQVLKIQYDLNEPDMDGMLLVSRKGKYSGRKCEYIRIFDPSSVAEGAANPKKYADFLEASANRKALLFEGRIESIEGSERVFLSKQRVA